MDVRERACHEALYGRPGGRCYFCGGVMDVLQLYHIVGGTDEGDENDVQVAHVRCVVQVLDRMIEARCRHASV